MSTEEATQNTHGRTRLSFASEADIDEFVSVLEKYERGEMTPDQWRVFRLVRGTYGQRQTTDSQMLRVKIPQGMITSPQLNENELEFVTLNAGYAVMFFYMISGFLITYTLTRNYDRSLAGTLKFYRKRFVRIFSLYWPLVLVAFLVVDLAWPGFVGARPLDKAISLFLFGMDWRIWAANAFAPSDSSHHVSWYRRKP